MDLVKDKRVSVVELSSVLEDHPLGRVAVAPPLPYPIIQQPGPLLLVPKSQKAAAQASTAELIPQKGDRQISEAAIAFRLEQTRNELANMQKTIDGVKKEIIDLQGDAADNRRFSTFQLKEHRNRVSALDDVKKTLSALRSRVEVLDSRADGNYHAYNSMEAVSRRLTELNTLERTVRILDRRSRVTFALLCIAVVSLAAVGTVLALGL